MDFDWSECAKDKDGIQVRKAKVARLKAKSDELEHPHQGQCGNTYATTAAASNTTDLPAEFDLKQPIMGELE